MDGFEASSDVSEWHFKASPAICLVCLEFAEGLLSMITPPSSDFPEYCGICYFRIDQQDYDEHWMS